MSEKCVGKSDGLSISPYLNGDFQVVYFKTDAVVKDMAGYRSGKAPESSRRGEVFEFSYKSRKRLAFWAANTSVEFVSMLTLTYHPSFAPKTGAGAKVHLNAFLTRTRRMFPGFQYLWFFEFTKRGIPHFHVLANVLPPGRLTVNKRGALHSIKANFDMSRTWARLVGAEGSKMDVASVSWEKFRSRDGAARYATKYAYKMEQKVVPETLKDVGRFWGASRGTKPVPVKVEVKKGSELKNEGFGMFKNDEKEIFYQVQFGSGLGSARVRDRVPRKWRPRVDKKVCERYNWVKVCSPGEEELKLKRERRCWDDRFGRSSSACNAKGGYSRGSQTEFQF